MNFHGGFIFREFKSTKINHKEYLLLPVTVTSDHKAENFSGKCPAIIPFLATAAAKGLCLVVLSLVSHC